MDDAEKVFANRFGFSPYEEKCPCCGVAYIPEEFQESLRYATADERGCEVTEEEYGTSEQPIVRYDGSLCEYRTLEVYLGDGEAEVIYADQISEEDLESFETEYDDWKDDDIMDYWGEEEGY
jgi:hypothetical protein